MARWKARVEFLLSVVELFFYLLRLRHYKAKCVKTCCLQDGVSHLEPRFQGKSLPPANILIGRSLGAKISGEAVVPGEYVLVSTKLNAFCYLTVQTAPCYVPSF